MKLFFKKACKWQFKRINLGKSTLMDRIFSLVLVWIFVAYPAEAQKKPTRFNLTVNLTSGGTVSSSSGGISCPSICTATLNAGASITLTAAADPNAEFLGWADACGFAGTSATCTLTINQDTIVSASFLGGSGGGGSTESGGIPVGTEPNSLLYWNGVAWAELLPPADTRGQFTLKLIDGGLTWEGGCITGLAVGDPGPAGGTVIAINGDGCGGLEVAPDELFGPWATDEYCNHNLVGTQRAVGTGEENTQQIITLCDRNTAAYLASTYTHNGFSDWYLPSYEELRLVFNNRPLVPGLCDNPDANHRWYWSSSESSASWNALPLCCDPTSQWDVNKGVGFPVRPIRAF